MGFAIFVGGEWHFDGDDPPGFLEILLSSEGDDEMADEMADENDGVVLRRTDECATPCCQGRAIQLNRNRWVHQDDGMGLCSPVGNPTLKAGPKTPGLPPPTSQFWDSVPS